MLSVLPASAHARANVVARGVWVPSPETSASVTQILADVQLRGDAAVVDCARRYDDPQFDISKLRVPIPMHEGARALVPAEIGDALRRDRQRIERFLESQRPADASSLDADGTRGGVRFRPLDAVAVYVHGGAGSGASAVLRAVVPAKAAGVSRVIVLAPPRGGSVDPAVLFACSLCEVDELYAVGGAHALAAAALGTESIARVEKIVGAGGPFVSEAKRQLYGVCEVDALGAPPEMLVVADDGASSEYVVGELLAQAEREPFARVFVLSESRPLLDAVAQLVDTLGVRNLPGGEAIARVVDGSCYLLHAQTRTEAFEAIEAIAPDVLVLQVRDPQPYFDRVRHVRVVLVGDMTPLASARYVLGPGPREFLRSYTVLENSRERMFGDAQYLAALCEYESLPHHAHAARLRNG